ncbi:MAG TPA: ATP-binding cassette domain-containing protein [Acidimicrobiales bacterium]|jgi:ABC-type branched-subunit amino acid transport system ATPase component/ABC-type branched-subunit amino acid transport system permease subunit|nr:ATP-binding cassette domain-containing protein [Acidimicrobiales bacterium]
MAVTAPPSISRAWASTPARLRGVILTLAAALVLLFAVPAVWPHSAPRGQILNGAEIGAVNGLLALGLVLTYRASRVINFSYGAMGALAATVAVELNLAHHVNWFVCIGIALLVGAALGLLVDFVIRWRFFSAPRLIVMVVTIGLAQLFGGIQLLVPGWLNGPSIVGGVNTPLSSHHVLIFPVLFNGNDLLIAIVVPVVLVAMGWFLLRTDAGVAVRSVADNSDRARLLGIPVRRLSTLVWVIAGLLAGLTSILSAPSAGITIAAGAGPTLILPALAAAIIAGMESLPLAFGAGVALGITSGLFEFNMPRFGSAVGDVVNLVAILVGLLFLQRKRSRADDAEESFSSTGILKPIPEVLRSLPEVKAGRIGIMALVGVIIVVIPLVSGPGTTLEYTAALIYGIIAISLVVLTGWSGNVSLGQFAFAGVGGVLAGDLIEKSNTDLFLALAAAGGAGAVLAVVVGIPALRIRGAYLAAVTLALGVAMDTFFLNPTYYPNIIPQAFLRPVLWQRFDLASNKAFYFLCLGFLVLTILFIQGLRRARSGRVLLATRDNEKAAAAMSVPPVRTKLAGFVLAGAIAGIAGGLYAVLLGAVAFNTFDPSYGLVVFSMAVIGGLGSISGVLMGVGLIEVLSYSFPKYQLVFTGVGLLLVLLFLPGGLAEGVQSIRDRLLKIAAERRQILVPSLVADRKVELVDHAPEETAILEHALSEERDDDVGGPGARRPVLVPVPDTRDEDTAQVLLPTAGAAAGGLIPETPVVLSCQRVEVSYGPVQILFGVDLDVHEGEIVALLGTNGAGKSTLLKGASGLVKVGGGAVWLDGAGITGEAAETVARKGLSLMPGGRGVFPTLSVDENLRLGTWMIRKDNHAVSEAKTRVIDLFPILRQRAHQQAGNLSGGEQQMLSLAMALMVKPKVLMIDELSLGLAPTVVAQLLEVVKLLHATGTTIVVVEQSVNVALELAERAVFLEKGEVRFSGRTRDLLERPDILRSVFIAGAGSVEGTVVTPDAGPTDLHVHASASSALVMADPGKRIPPSEEAPSILECNGVRKTFGGITAIEDISLTLRDGEILGLIGHNGAGKTTFFDCVSGFLPLDGGRIRLGGADIDTWPAYMRAAAGLGRTFQEARLYPSLTVAETIAVAQERHLRSRAMVAAGLRLPASLDSEAEVAVKAEQLVEMMGLGAFREKLVGELSTGTRRIVELACVLAQEPGVLLLDEPSGGVAQRETEAMGPLLIRVQQHTGCSILVVEHDMPLLTAICDRMIALELGEVIAEGTPSEVLEHPAVIESYLGTDESTINRSGVRV